MKRVLFFCAVFAVGCVANRAELEAQQAALDLELATAMAKADNLNEFRKDADALEARLEAGLQEFPALGDEWKAMQALPGTIIAPRPPLTLPPESLFEGSAGAAKRVRLADTDARLRQLDKVLGEVVRIELHNQRARKMLEAIERARAARPQ